MITTMVITIIVAKCLLNDKQYAVCLYIYIHVLSINIAYTVDLTEEICSPKITMNTAGNRGNIQH